MMAASVLERGDTTTVGPRGAATRHLREVGAGSAAEPAPPVEPSPPAGGGAESPEAVCMESLVASAVAGEPGARDRLLGQIHPFVLRYCRGRLGRQETASASAEDVAQEVCLAVVSALPTYTMKGLSFRAFVYGIAAHKVTDAFRAMGRNRAEPVADLPDSPVDDDGPEHRMLAVELNRRLSGLLEMLTPRQREVLVLRVVVGLSAEETAAAVRSTPGAVRVTQHRALNRLRTVAVRGDDGLVVLAELSQAPVPAEGDPGAASSPAGAVG